MYCLVPISALMSSPYYLSQGALVIADVAAINAIGTGTYSVDNTAGALIETIPLTPPVAPLRDSQTTSTTLVVDITALTGTATGGATIDSYDIQMNTSSGWVS